MTMCVTLQRVRDIIAFVFKFYTLFTRSIVALQVCQSREWPNPELSFKNGPLSGLKSYYSSTKDECEGVEFVTKVNDILDAL